MSDLGRGLMMMGLVMLALGGSIWLFSRLGLPLGSLPGDVVIRHSNYTLYLPISTAILLSLMLTLVVNVFLRR